MQTNQEIRLISGNDFVHDVLESEIDRLGARLPLVNPRITRSSSLKHAREKIQRVKPTLIVLDPETPSKDGMQSAREISAMLDGLDGKAPILVALTHSDQGWARETILRPSLLVWKWEIESNETNDCTLDQLVPLLLKPANKRRVRAVIRLRLPTPICDVSIGDATLFRDLPLKVDDIYRRDWREDLQNLFDMENQKTSWGSLADKGFALFKAIFNDFGAALVDARDNGTALDLRFEIDPDEVEKLFAMPIELLNRELKWEGFFCRTTAMARRVKPRTAYQPRNVATRPVLLFVDASATRGNMDVIGQSGKLESRTFRDLSDAVTAEQEELDRLQDFCQFELLKTDNSSGLKDVLQDRLADASQPIPDIIHFTGHAITTEAGGTELIFPSNRLGEVDRLSVEAFAAWLPANVQLVVLSACQGISLDTARHLHAAKGVAVLGFRCEVKAGAAAEFVINFYKERLKRRATVADAYKAACFMGNAANFAWAAAVLLDHD